MTKIKEDDYIVAIGASAGGLEALQLFFDNVSEESDHIYVVIQHLSPDHKSMMANLLSSHTELQVEQITQGMIAKQGHVYVIPPKMNLSISDGVFHLSEKPNTKELNLPIDIFFSSIAKEYEKNAIGVVLSGTGSDGSLGLKNIKENGGICIVQDPVTAKFDGMPLSAISTDCTDIICEVDKIPLEIENLIESQNDIEDLEKTIFKNDYKFYNSILSSINKACDIDFFQYKTPTIARRISRRMGLNGIPSIEEYVDRLNEDLTELNVLSRELLIGVTKFFRDENAFEHLEKHVIPKIVENSLPDQPIKVWCCACSTGEEAYSLAMLFSEAIQKSGLTRTVKIFASDISKENLEIASVGSYSESLVAGISQDRLNRFFKKDSGQYKIVSHIRSMIIFSQHNTLSDPPFNKMDLVTCRNFMIYLNQEAQTLLLGSLHFALKESGYIMLGPSESLGTYDKLVTEVSRRWKIYKNNVVSKTAGSLLPRLTRLSESTPQKEISFGKGAVMSKKEKFDAFLNDSILEMFDASGVYLNDFFDIVKGYGDLRGILKAPSYGFSHNLLDLLEPKYKNVIGTAIRKAKREKVSVFLKIEDDQSNIKPQVKIIPIDPTELGSIATFLVLFVDFQQSNSFEAPKQQTVELSELERIKELESALIETREDLQATAEEADASNEELQATNEELLASNEELQSTNEELQSVNEELHTVNYENQLKIHEIEEVNADLDTLIKSIQIGTIFIDDKLAIRRFTPSVEEHFNLLHTDIGRPITDFHYKFDNIDIHKHVKEVLISGEVKEVELPLKDDKHFLLRILPSKLSNGNVNGAIITFIEVTDLKNTQKELEERGIQLMNLNKRMNSVLGATNSAYWEMDIESGKLMVSDAFKELFGYSQKENIDSLEWIYEHISESEIESFKNKTESLINESSIDSINTEIEVKDKSGKFQSILFRGTKNVEKNKIYGVIVNINDLSKN